MLYYILKMRRKILLFRYCYADIYAPCRLIFRRAIIYALYTLRFAAIAAAIFAMPYIFLRRHAVYAAVLRYTMRRLSADYAMLSLFATRVVAARIRRYGAGERAMMSAIMLIAARTYARRY